MSEARHMHQLLLALGTLGVFSWCYARGGRSNTWIRRFLGAGVFVAGCAGLAVGSGVWSWWMLGALPSYPAALALGYGAETRAAKVCRRALYGAAVGAASGWFLLPVSWPLWLFQVGLASSASVFYGVVNPTSAVGEEGGLAVLLVGAVPFGLIR